MSKISDYLPQTKERTVSDFEVPFSYLNTCSLGLLVFDACDCGMGAQKATRIQQQPTTAGTPESRIAEVDINISTDPKNLWKPLMFVNHDAKHLKPQVTRSEITSHCRGSYQPWKRRMQIRVRRDATKEMKGPKPSIVSTESDWTGSYKNLVVNRNATELSQTVFEEDMTWRETSSSPEFDQNEKRRERDNNIASRALSPVRFHGNSDPFSSLSLNITPLIAELINFEHSHLHPCVYSSKTGTGGTYGTSYLSDLHGPSANQAAVYGYLSRAAFVLSSASPDPRYGRLALVLKGKSIMLLRAQLFRSKTIDRVDVTRKMLALMVAEIFAHNYDAAQVHSKVLMILLKEQSEGNKDIDMRFFFSIVYSETQRSCMSLTHPCFDPGPNGWVASTFDMVGGEAYESFVSLMKPTAEQTDPSVINLGSELAHLFKEVRSIRAVSRVYSNSSLYGTPNPLALYLPAQVVMCLAKLVSYYVDHCQLRDRHGHDCAPWILIRRAAVLAMLFWVRKSGQIDSIRVSSSSTIYSAGPTMLRKLQDTLSRFDRLASTVEKERYRNLRFWTLYVGALDEQAKTDSRRNGRRWFIFRLAEAALDIKVSNWPQARQILELFPYSDTCEPHGSRWFSSIFTEILTGMTATEGGFATKEPSYSRQDTNPEYAANVNHKSTYSILRQDLYPALLFESRLPAICPRNDNSMTYSSDSVRQDTVKRREMGRERQVITSIIPRPCPSTMDYRSWDMLPKSYQSQSSSENMLHTIKPTSFIPDLTSFSEQEFRSTSRDTSRSSRSASDRRTSPTNVISDLRPLWHERQGKEENEPPMNDPEGLKRPVEFTRCSGKEMTGYEPVCDELGHDYLSGSLEAFNRANWAD